MVGKEGKKSKIKLKKFLSFLFIFLSKNKYLVFFSVETHRGKNGIFWGRVRLKRRCEICQNGAHLLRWSGCSPPAVCFLGGQPMP